MSAEQTAPSPSAFEQAAYGCCEQQWESAPTSGAELAVRERSSDAPAYHLPCVE